MPRKPREKSESGIYHIILRGANRQEIFYETADSRRFLETLGRYAGQSGTKVYGWCLMDNHVHLLLGEGNEELSLTMKRIGVSFVLYYNRKYNTTGHLFQDRFKSEKVESDEYLLTVIRYIHQNPVKAGMVKRAEDWKWSSCRSYYGDTSDPAAALLDSDLVLGLLSAERHHAILRFKEFNEALNDDICLDHETTLRMTDEEARQSIINHISGIEVTRVKGLPKAERNEVLRKIKAIKGISQRQAARILGISPSVIFKA